MEKRKRQMTLIMADGDAKRSSKEYSSSHTRAWIEQSTNLHGTSLISDAQMPDFNQIHTLLQRNEKLQLPLEESLALAQRIKEQLKQVPR